MPESGSSPLDSGTAAISTGSVHSPPCASQLRTFGYTVPIAGLKTKQLALTLSPPLLPLPPEAQLPAVGAAFEWRSPQASTRASRAPQAALFRVEAQLSAANATMAELKRGMRPAGTSAEGSVGIGGSGGSGGTSEPQSEGRPAHASTAPAERIEGKSVATGIWFLDHWFNLPGTPFHQIKYHSLPLPVKFLLSVAYAVGVVVQLALSALLAAVVGILMLRILELLIFGAGTRGPASAAPGVPLDP